MMGRRSLVVGLFGILSLLPREARADEDFEVYVAVFSLIGGLGATDLGFTIHDAVLFAEGRRPAEPVAIAETAVAAPQALIGHIALAALAHDRSDDELTLMLTGPAMMVSALTTHGIWSLARPDEAPNVLFGASTVIGINSLWTTVSISSAFDGKLPREPLGVLKIATAGPATAWSIAEAVRGETFQPGWIALSGWSGAVVVHGVVDIIRGDDDLEADVAEDLYVGPTTIADGAGVGVSGRF